MILPENIETKHIKIVILKSITKDLLKNCEYYLIMQQLDKLELKIKIIPNELAKYMSFNINKKLDFMPINFTF